MLLKFFKQTLPQVIVTIIIITLLLWVKSLFSSHTPSFYWETISMPLYSSISSWLSGNYLWSKVISLTLVFFTGFYLLQVNSKHIVVKQRTYFISFLYLIITSSIIFLQQINPAIFAAFFMVFAVDHILSIYHKDNALDNLFKAGFFTALAALFYAPSIFYFAAILLSIISIRSFNPKEWFVTIFGLIAPLFFYFFYFYFVKNDLFYGFDIFIRNILTEVNSINNTLLWVLLSFYAIIFIASGIFLIKTLPNQKISVRKYHGVFFWFNLVTILIVIIVPTISYEIIFIALIPIVFQYTHYFTITTKRFWPNLLFIAILLFALVMQFYIIE